MTSPIIPPPVVLGVFALLAWGAAAGAPALAFALPVPFWVAALLLLPDGVLLPALAVWQFLRAQTTVSPLRPDKTARLVTGGVYRFSRNPMYLGMVCLLLLWGLYLGNFLSLICAPLFAAFIARFQIVPEEAALREKFGREYEEYAKVVRRWL